MYNFVPCICHYTEVVYSCMGVNLLLPVYTLGFKAYPIWGVYVRPCFQCSDEVIEKLNSLRNLFIS